MGGFFLWWLADLVLILTGRYRDAHGYPLGNPNPVLGQGCLFAFIAFMVVMFLSAMFVGDAASESASTGRVSIALIAAGIAFLVGYRRKKR
jgi:hypothetical protein